MTKMVQHGKLKRARSTNATPRPPEGAYAVALREVKEYQRSTVARQRRQALMAAPPAKTILL